MSEQRPRELNWLAPGYTDTLLPTWLSRRCTLSLQSYVPRLSVSQEPGLRPREAITWGAESQAYYASLVLPLTSFLLCKLGSYSSKTVSVDKALWSEHTVSSTYRLFLMWKLVFRGGWWVQDKPQNTAPGCIEYLRLKEFEKRAELENSPDLPPLPFFPETGHKTLMWRFPPCIRRKGDILIPRDGEFGAEKSV